MKTEFQKKYPSLHAFKLGKENGKLCREQEEEDARIDKRKVERPSDSEWETAIESDATDDVPEDKLEAVTQAWIDGCNAGWESVEDEAGLRECND